MEETAELEADERCGYCGSEEDLMGSLSSPTGCCCLGCVLAAA